MHHGRILRSAAPRRSIRKRRWSGPAAGRPARLEACLADRPTLLHAARARRSMCEWSRNSSLPCSGPSPSAPALLGPGPPRPARHEKAGRGSLALFPAMCRRTRRGVRATVRFFVNFLHQSVDHFEVISVESLSVCAPGGLLVVNKRYLFI